MTYAFADADGSEAGKSKVRDGWRAKNVEPILYDRRNGHRLLAETLIEWAGVRKDPFHARSRIAINEMARMPDDAVAERVVWALDDPVAAKALADEPPVVDEDEYGKLEQWLDVFAEQGLLWCDAGDVEPVASDRRSMRADISNWRSAKRTSGIGSGNYCKTRKSSHDTRRL